jgi:hypothetical protein
VSIETLVFCGFLEVARNLHHARPKMGATSTQRPKAQSVDNRGVRIIAKSVYRELRNSGHSRSDIVAFTNAVLELVTTELRDAQEAAE